MKPFEEVFAPEIAPVPGLYIREVRLNETTMHMDITLQAGEESVTDAQRDTLAAAIRDSYELAGVHISVARDTPKDQHETKLAKLMKQREHTQEKEKPGLAELEARREAFLREAASRLPPPKPKDKAGKKGISGPVLLGRALKGEPAAMETVDGDSGKVTVSGVVFGVDSRKTKKGFLLSFTMTDLTSSVRVVRFFRDEEGERIGQAIHKGLYLTVQGKMEWDTRREWDEPVLRPDNIFKTDDPRKPRQDNAPQKRVELHLHTRMSDMDATTDLKALLKRVRDWGHRAVAITDHGVLHAYPDAMNIAHDISKAMKKEGKGEGLHILYGCEAYYVGDGLPEKRRAWHMILLARDKEGLRGLYEITSQAHVNHFHYHPTVPRALLTQYREHLVVGSACEAGELFSAIVEGKPREELLAIAGEYDFLEIQPLCNNAFLLREGKTEDDLRAFNQMVVSLGEELGIPVAATGDVHFLDPEDEIYRKILLASKGMDSGYPVPLYFRTTEEMLSEFAYLGEQKAKEVVIDNTNMIAGWCEALMPVPRGKFFPPHIKGSAEELRRLAFDKAHALYGDPLPALIEERIHKELDPIIRKGYDVIYMTAQKLVAKSLSEGYLVGSRGSVGSSVVAFFAGITEVNALPPHYRCPACRFSDFPQEPEGACGADLPSGKACPECGQEMDRDGYDIPFATFLGFDADKKPDIDLNFSGEYQARAHQHTVELFGEDKVFRAGTIATVADKTAIGFVRKYLEENHLSRPPAEVERLALGCTGVRRTTGQHPGGLIVVPEENDIHEFCPVQHPANKKESGVITTHFDYHSIEDNLLKLDLLGHDDPTMIRRMEEITGADAQKIPLDDAETMSLYRSSAALGYENDPALGPTGACALPEFGTRFVREMLCMTRPTTFDELIRICGLAHGTDVWLGNAADLIRDGKATLKEVVCARDDITTFLIAKGMDKKLSFTISESVRKGKGLKPDWEEAMVAAGVPYWYIESCQKIQYMFPKAHAVAYCLMSFRVAYFKMHQPLAFYSAYFSIRANALEVVLECKDEQSVRRRVTELLRMPKLTPADEDKLTTLEVCLEFLLRGFSFLPIDLYASDAARFTLEPGGLRIPFLAIAGLGERAASDLVEQRAAEPFVSAEELLSRCRGLNSTHLAQLRAMGALGDLPDSTQLSLFT